MVYDTIEYKDYTVKIEYDESADSPRERGDPIGKIFATDRRYQHLADESITDRSYLEIPRWNEELEDEEEVAVDIEEYLKHNYNAVLVVPLRFDISGYGDAVWVSDLEDATGAVYATAENLESFFGKDYDLDKVRKCIEGEIEELNAYYKGEVFGYRIFRPGTENDDTADVDACWGYYGCNFKDNGLEEAYQSAVDYDIEQVKKGKEERRQHFEQVWDNIVLSIQQGDVETAKKWYWDAVGRDRDGEH